MANAVITVLEADGTTETDVTVLDVGRQAAAASKSVAASTEDKAVLDAIAASLALLDNSIPSGNELQVDVVGALPAGTNNIGDVDVLTVPADPMGVNADAASATGSISAKLRAIATALGTSALDLGVGTGGSRTLRVAIDSSQVAGSAVSASATFTPAASSHTAGDCNGAAQEFALSAPSAGRIMITSASLEIDGGTAEATAWRLFLFNVTPPSAVADDSPHTLPSGDRSAFLGFIDLGTAVDQGDTQWIETHGINKQIKLAGTSVFGYLVNLTTLTPANVAHIVTLHAVPL